MASRKKSEKSNVDYVGSGADAPPPPPATTAGVPMGSYLDVAAAAAPPYRLAEFDVQPLRCVVVMALRPTKLCDLEILFGDAAPIRMARISHLHQPEIGSVWAADVLCSDGAVMKLQYDNRKENNKGRRLRIRPDGTTPLKVFYVADKFNSYVFEHSVFENKQAAESALLIAAYELISLDTKDLFKSAEACCGSELFGCQHYALLRQIKLSIKQLLRIVVDHPNLAHGRRIEQLTAALDIAAGFQSTLPLLSVDGSDCLDGVDLIELYGYLSKHSDVRWRVTCLISGAIRVRFDEDQTYSRPSEERTASFILYFLLQKYDAKYRPAVLSRAMKDALNEYEPSAVTDFVSRGVKTVSDFLSLEKEHSLAIDMLISLISKTTYLGNKEDFALLTSRLASIPPSQSSDAMSLASAILQCKSFCCEAFCLRDEASHGLFPICTALEHHSLLPPNITSALHQRVRHLYDATAKECEAKSHRERCMALFALMRTVSCVPHISDQMYWLHDCLPLSHTADDGKWLFARLEICLDAQDPPSEWGRVQSELKTITDERKLLNFRNSLLKRLSLKLACERPVRYVGTLILLWNRSYSNVSTRCAMSRSVKNDQALAALDTWRGGEFDAVVMEILQFQQLSDLYAELVGPLAPYVLSTSVAGIEPLLNVLNVRCGVDAVEKRFRAKNFTVAQFGNLCTLDIASGIARINPSFNVNVVTDIQTSIDNATCTATKLSKVIVEHILPHPTFVNVRQNLMDLVDNIATKINDCPCDTISDDIFFGPGSATLIKSAVQLEQRLHSVFFTSMWKQNAALRQVLPPESANDNVTQAWVKAVAEVDQQYCGLWKSLAARETEAVVMDELSSMLRSRFPADCSALPTAPPANERAARIALQRNIRQARSDFINEEAVLAMEASSVVIKDVAGVIEFLLTYVDAAEMLPDLKGIAEAANALSTDKEELTDFITLLSATNRNVSEIVSCASSFFVRYPDLVDCVRGFPEAFGHLLREQFVRELKKEPKDIEAFIQRRSSDVLDEHSLELLAAFQSILRVLSNSDADFCLLRCGRANCITSLISFISASSGAIRSAQFLRGRVAEIQALQDESGQKQTLTQALRIMRFGTFSIFLSPITKVVEVGACIPISSDQLQQLVEEFSQSELDDFPPQLLNAANVEVDDNDLSLNTDGDEGVDTLELPEDLRPGNRLRVAQRFTALYEKLQDLRDAVQGLVNAGHPAQKQLLPARVDGNITALDVYREATEIRNLRNFWETTVLPKARDNSALSAFLSRGQIAEIVWAIDEGKVDVVWCEMRKACGVRDEASGGIKEAFVAECTELRRSFSNDRQHQMYYAQHMDMVHALMRKLVPSTFQRVFAALRSSSATDNCCVDLGEGSLSLLRLQVSPEELLCFAAGIAQNFHGCTPTPLDLFVCTAADTTEAALQDFLVRWGHFQLVRQELRLPEATVQPLFVVVNVQALTKSMQQSLVSGLSRFHSSAGAKLLLLSTEDTLANQCFRGVDTAPKSNQPIYKMLRASTKEAFQRLDDVFVVSTAEAQSGKSRAIHQKAIQSKKLYAQVAILKTSTRESIVEDLAFIHARAHSISPKTRRLLLHLDVSFEVDVEFLNRLLFDFIVLKQYADGTGRIVERDPRDTIVVELASSNFKRPDPPVIAFIESLPVPQRIAPTNIEFTLVQPRIYSLRSVPDEALVYGSKILIHVSQAQETFTIPCGQYMEAIPTPSSDDIIAAAKMLAGNLTAGALLRFYKFYARQLAFLFHRDKDPYYKDLSPTLHHDARLILRFACHLALLAARISRDLAAEAVPPLSATFQNDDERFNNIKSFAEWSRMPFLLTNGSEHRLITLGDENFFDQLTRTDPDKYYQSFMQEHKSFLKVQGRSDLQQQCATVSVVEGFRANGPLAAILEIVGLYPGRIAKFFHNLETVTNHLEDVTTSAFQSAAEILASLGHPLPDNATCFDLLLEAQSWKTSLFGSPSSHEKPPFVLTVDLLARMAAMKLRIVSNIPVVFVGETGCGKTACIDRFAKLSGSKYHVINVNGGLTTADLREKLSPIVAEAQAHPEHMFIVQLDEINTLRDMWVAKLLLNDHFLMGEKLPSNLRFIAMMNPVRQRTETQQQLLTEVDKLGGLNYSRYASSSSSSAKLATVNAVTSKQRFVYQVSRSPESMLSLAWEFGTAAKNFSTREEALRTTRNRTPLYTLGQVSDEVLFAESIAHWMIQTRLKPFETVTLDLDREDDDDDAAFLAPSSLHGAGLASEFCAMRDTGGTQHWELFRSVVCVLLEASQCFMRSAFGNDESVVSLRDMRRTLHYIPFIMNCFVNRCRAHGKFERHGEFMRFLGESVQCSLILGYYLRLDAGNRTKYLQHIWVKWTSERRHFERAGISATFLAPPTDSSLIYGAFNNLAEYMCGALSARDKLAINQALKENVFALFASVVTRQPMNIVGRPGSTKTRAVESIVNATDPTCNDRECIFFRYFRSGGSTLRVQKFVLQCSRYTRPSDIERVVTNAAKMQQSNPSNVCIVVLEEVGVTIDSEQNPLMVLHGLIDHGVLLPDGSRMIIPIVGISNWMLDGSKMNRAQTVHRGNPPREDLELTGSHLLGFTPSWLERFTQTFSTHVLATGDTSNTWFYGMRDFYSFLTTLRKLQHQSRLMEFDQHFQENEISPHLAYWALEIAFGGMPSSQQQRGGGDASREEKSLIDNLRQCFQFGNQHDRATYTWIDGDKSTRVCPICCSMKLAAKVFCDPRSKNVSSHNKRQLRKLILNEHATPLAQNFECTMFSDASISHDIDVMSYALANKESRHLLIFSQDSNAVRLLYHMKLATQGESLVIFGSTDFKSRARDLLRVRECFRSGSTLILVNAHHLYEALLDPLNMNYAVEGTGDATVFRTRLPLADGYSQSVRIHPKFRCIVLCTEGNARSLLPPFLNRFVKTSLSFDAALTVQQQNCARSLRTRSMLPQLDLPVLALTAPGFSKESIPSLVLADGSYNPNTFGVLINDTKLMQRLAACVSTKWLVALREGADFPTLSPDELDVCTKWEEASYVDGKPTTLSLKGLSELWQEFTDLSHLVIMTQQSQWQQEDVCRSIVRVVEDQYDSSVRVRQHRLDSNTPMFDFVEDGDRMFTKYIASFSEEVLADDEALVGILLWDTSIVDCSTANDLFHYVASSPQQASRHLIVVALVPSPYAPPASHNFSLVFEPQWLFAFVDELAVSFQDVSSGATRVPSILDLTLSDKVALTMHAATEVAQHFSSRSMSTSKIVAYAQSLLGDDGVSKQILTDMCGDKFLLAVPELCQPTWRTIPLQRRVVGAASLRQTLLMFFSKVFGRVLARFLPLLMAVGEQFARADHPHHLLFVELLNDRSLFDFSLNRGILELTSPFTVSPPHTAPPSVTAFASKSRNHHGGLQFIFPFSATMEHMYSCAAERIGGGSLEQLFGVTISTEASLDYCCDVLVFAFGAASHAVGLQIMRCLAVVFEMSEARDAPARVQRHTPPHEALHRLVSNSTTLVVTLVRLIHNDSIALKLREIPNLLCPSGCIFRLLQKSTWDLQNVADVFFVSEAMNDTPPLSRVLCDAIALCMRCVDVSAEEQSALDDFVELVVKNGGTAEPALTFCFDHADRMNRFVKYLTPALLDSATSLETTFSVCCTVASRESNIIPSAVVAAVMMRMVNMWLQHCFANEIVSPLGDGGCMDEETKLILSRTCFRLLVEKVDALDTLLAEENFNKLFRMQEQCVTASMVKVACVNAAIAVVVDALVSSVVHTNGEEHTNDSPQLQRLVGAINRILAQCNEEAFLVDNTTIFFLRQITCGGTEVPRAVAILSELSATSIPTAIMEHTLVKTMMVDADVSDTLRLVKGCEIATTATTANTLAPLRSLAVAAAAASRIIANDIQQSTALLTLRQDAAPPPLRTLFDALSPGGKLHLCLSTEWKRLIAHAAVEMHLGNSTVMRHFAQYCVGTLPHTIKCPSITDYAEMEYILSQPDATFAYRCPNNHLYVTNACEHIHSQGVCSECGARIGGPSYGVLHPGNRQIGAVQAILADPRGYLNETFGYVEGVGRMQTVRVLSGVALLVTRFLLQTSLVVGALQLPDGGNLLNFINDARSTLEKLRQVVAPGGTDVSIMEFLHGVIAIILPVAQRPCTTRDEVEAEMVTRLQNCRLNLAADVRQQLLHDEGKAQLHHALSWDDQHEYTIQAMPLQELLQQKPMYYAYKPKCYASAMIERATSPIPALKELLKRASSITQNCALHLLSVLRFLRVLVRCCRQAHPQLTVAEANQIPMKVILDQHGELADYWARFETAMAFFAPKIERYQCTNLQEEFEAVFASPREEALSYFLPDVSDNGIFIQSLYSGYTEDGSWISPASAQRELVSELNGEVPDGQLYYVVEEDIIAVDAQGLISQIVLAYHCEPCDVPELSADVTDVLPARVVAEARLSILRRLPDALPPYPYYRKERLKQGALSNLLDAFEMEGERVPYSDVAPAAITRLMIDVKQVTEMAEALISLLTYLAIRAKDACDAIRQRRRDHGLSISLESMSLMDLLRDADDLTTEQQLAKDFMEQHRYVFALCDVTHIPTILGLLFDPERSLPKWALDPLLDVHLVRESCVGLGNDEALRAQVPQYLVALRLLCMGAVWNCDERTASTTTVLGSISLVGPCQLLDNELFTAQKYHALHSVPMSQLASFDAMCNEILLGYCDRSLLTACGGQVEHETGRVSMGEIKAVIRRHATRRAADAESSRATAPRPPGRPVHVAYHDPVEHPQPYPLVIPPKPARIRWGSSP